MLPDPTRPPDTPPALHLEDVVKRYPSVVALSGVSFEVPPGSVTLLAGPNGAGKTTLLRILLDLASRQSGRVQVFDLDPVDAQVPVRAATGFLPEELDFPFPMLRVREVLDFQSRFRPTWDPEYAETLATELELPRNQRWRELSKGQRRRVQITAALAHRPPLLLLDEPTDGLDPVGRERVLSLLATHLAETGATALYCTHVVAEAQGLADRLVVLKRGQVRVAESVDTLRRTLFRIEFRGGEAPPTPPGGDPTPAGTGPSPAATDPTPSAAEPTLQRTDRTPSLIRREGSQMGSERWVLRGSEEAIRGWATDTGLDLLSLDTLTPAEAVLAYLSPNAPATGDPR